MKNAATLIICAVALAYLVGTGPGEQDPQMPPNHPQLPQQVPPGHPTLPQQPGESGPSAPQVADPADVASVDALVSAYYEVISGPAGEARDWDRFRSLFLPEARFITAKTISGRSATINLTPEQFIRFNQKYFEGSGYFEAEVNRRTDTFGNIAHVFSTYEARHKLSEPEPYSRGINSIQILGDGRRWWIANVMWDYERPDENPIPPEYLPDSTGGAD